MRRSPNQSLLVLLFLSFLVLTQVGCGEDSNADTSNGAEEATATETENPFDLDDEEDDDDYEVPDGGDEGDVDDGDDGDNDDGDDDIADYDLDGVADEDDNCIHVYNPYQQDTNGDGFGNICDPDLDNDHDVDDVDYSLFVDAYYDQDPIADFDSDGDVDGVDYEIFWDFYYNYLPPGPSGDNGDVIASHEHLLIYDSFTRGDDFYLSSNDPIWEQLILDNGNGAYVDSALYRSGEIVDTVSGTNAIFFKGRQGGSKHKLYLIAEPLDVRTYHRLKMNLVYMPIDLESGESVRVEYCVRSAYDCDPGKASDWVVVFESNSAENSELGRMKNWNADDFQWFNRQAEIDLDLVSGAAQRNFQFRIVVSIDEGIKVPQNEWPYAGETFEIEDSVAIDSFLVKGIY